jgi:probable rRNA maturation factor
MLPELTLSLQFGKIKDAEKHRAALARHKVTRWIRNTLEVDGEITVRIVDAEEGQTLNRDYRQKDYATNVLTFDYTQEPVVTADLVLCAPVIAKEANMIVHGTLHAQGWDHELDEDAEVMELRETDIMARLGFKNPY